MKQNKAEQDQIKIKKHSPQPTILLPPLLLVLAGRFSQGVELDVLLALVNESTCNVEGILP